jgi:two-component system NtrC family sensor kinase
VSGRETCLHVKSAPIMRHIPIIMLTAVEDRESMIQGLGAGADDYIAKSGDFELIRARVLAQIRRKQFEDENRQIREQLQRRELEAMEERAAREMAEARAALVDELQMKNEEMESFSYSVAHDLRAPLRAIDGFGLALLEDYGDKLDEEGQHYLRYVREAAQQMARLIDDLLGLSRVTSGEFRREPVDLSAIARRVVAGLRRADGERRIELVVSDELLAEGDGNLMTIALENLIGNAWKYTGRTDAARIEVGCIQGEHCTYFVRDNGAGFDMAYAGKLFGMFQRLHTDAEFEGNGIGLATVQRIIRRHGGRIWAEGAVGSGATFFFTLNGGARTAVPPAPSASARPREVAVAGASR